MLNLNKDQFEQLQTALGEYIEEESKKSVSKFDETLDTVVKKLIDEGWTLPAELPIMAVNALGNTNELNDVNLFMEQFYSHDDYRNMENMIGEIQESKIKDGLIKLINECWWAFKAQKYAICSTALVSAIEGILSEFSDDKRDTRMMKVCQKQVDTLPADTGTIIKHVWSSYNQFIRKLFHPSDFTKDEPADINRHWLSHGRSDFEIEEIDCMKLFNAIHSLCMVANKVCE